MAASGAHGWPSMECVATRVCYYMKYLVISPEGTFSPCLDWVVKSKDPKLMVHPLLVLLADLVWTRVALRSFIQRKLWFVFTLLVFVISQSIIKGLAQGNQEAEDLRYATFALRLFIYLFSMGQMIYGHVSKVVGACRRGEVLYIGKCLLPVYLTNWQESFNLVLMLILVGMLATEPILHCFGSDGAELFATACPEIKDMSATYYALNMIAMILYYTLLLDLAVFNNRVSAYLLVVIALVKRPPRVRDDGQRRARCRKVRF